MLKGIEGIEGLTPEQVEQINGLAGGLQGKNEELLKKLATTKESGSESKAELEALKQFKSNAEVKLAEEAKSYQEAKELMSKAHQDELAKVSGENEKLNSQLKALLIDNGISTALDEVNVNPDLKAGAIAMLKGQAQLTDGKAMIGEKSLSDAINEWAASDQGKHFCLAANNSGGGASGGNNSETANFKGKAFTDMTTAEKVAYMKSKK